MLLVPSIPVGVSGGPGLEWCKHLSDTDLQNLLAVVDEGDAAAAQIHLHLVLQHSKVKGSCYSVGKGLSFTVGPRLVYQ